MSSISFLGLGIVVVVLLTHIATSSTGSPTSVIPVYNAANWDEASGRLLCKKLVESVAARNSSMLDYVDPLLHDCFNEAWYNVDQLPKKPGSRFKPVEIEFDFEFKSLVKMENDGTLVMKATLQLSWKDELRRWDDTKIPIKVISVPASEVWTPHFNLVNCEKKNCFVVPKRDRKIEINSEGQTRLALSPLLQANCDMKLEKFPADQQECKLIFELNSIPQRFVHVVESQWKEGFIKFDNEEWDFLSLDDVASNFTYVTQLRDNSEPPKVDNLTGFNVTIKLRRHPHFYIYNLVVPVLIMSIIGVFSIFLEAGSNEKMGLVIMVLLGFMFFQDVISKQLPKSDQTPYLSKYLLWALIMAGVNLATCAMVVWVHSIQDSEDPKAKYIERHFLKPIFTAHKKIASQARRISMMIHKSTIAEEQENEKHFWHELASILNIAVSVFYIVTQSIIIVFYLLPCF